MSRSYRDQYDEQDDGEFLGRGCLETVANRLIAASSDWVATKGNRRDADAKREVRRMRRISDKRQLGLTLLAGC